MKTTTIQQIKSIIKTTQKQKKTIKALGLGKINQSKEVKLTPQVQGMLNKVKHLVKFT